MQGRKPLCIFAGCNKLLSKSPLSISVRLLIGLYLHFVVGLIIQKVGFIHVKYQNRLVQKDRRETKKSSIWVKVQFELH